MGPAGTATLTSFSPPLRPHPPMQLTGRWRAEDRSGGGCDDTSWRERSESATLG
jgi:hypothetical protein